jgi:hypothetical protein
MIHIFSSGRAQHSVPEDRGDNAPEPRQNRSAVGKSLGAHMIIGR